MPTLPDPGLLIDAAQLLREVLNDVQGKTFPLGIEIINQTQYNLKITPGFPFLPEANNPRQQWGQTGAPSIIGPTPAPTTIYAANKPDAADVGAFDGYGWGLDANVGCMSYQAVDQQGKVIFTFVIAWYMGGGKGVKHALLFSPGNTYAKSPYPSDFWIARDQGEFFSTVNSHGTPHFSPEWKTASIELEGQVKIGGKQEIFKFHTSPAGTVNEYQIELEINEDGFTPAD